MDGTDSAVENTTATVSNNVGSQENVHDDVDDGDKNTTTTTVLDSTKMSENNEEDVMMLTTQQEHDLMTNPENVLSTKKADEFEKELQHVRSIDSHYRRA